MDVAPALPDDCRPAPRTAGTTDATWRLVLTLLRDAAPDWTLKAAWRDVRDVAAARGWAWPSYATVRRRWESLPAAEQWTIRHGRAAAATRLAQPVQRDRTTLAPLDLLSLDGRVVDFWVTFPDGSQRRPIMLVLVDVATGLVAGWVLAGSGNAAATKRLIRAVVADHGIPGAIHPDTGRAFAGNVVAGGADFKWRGKRAARPGFTPPGICAVLGIDLVFAMPGNAQAKFAERTFADLSRAIDDRPEFSGAHAGHAPGARPGSRTVPVTLDVACAVIRRAVNCCKAEGGRRGRGIEGRSSREAVAAGRAGRIVTRATGRPLRPAGLG